MSSWEWFTWFNACVLGVGSVIVFVLFMRQLPNLLPRAPEPREEEPNSGPVDTGPRSD